MQVNGHSWPYPWRSDTTHCRTSLIFVTKDVTDLGKISRDLSSSASIGIITPDRTTILKGNKTQDWQGNRKRVREEGKAMAQGETMSLGIWAILAHTGKTTQWPPLLLFQGLFFPSTMVSKQNGVSIKQAHLLEKAGVAHALIMLQKENTEACCSKTPLPSWPSQNHHSEIHSV
jgi:hypothetical protein